MKNYNTDNFGRGLRWGMALLLLTQISSFAAGNGESSEIGLGQLVESIRLVVSSSGGETLTSHGTGFLLDRASFDSAAVPHVCRNQDALTLVTSNDPIQKTAIGESAKVSIVVVKKIDRFRSETSVPVRVVVRDLQSRVALLSVSRGAMAEALGREPVCMGLPKESVSEKDYLGTITKIDPSKIRIIGFPTGRDTPIMVAIDQISRENASANSRALQVSPLFSKELMRLSIPENQALDGVEGGVVVSLADPNDSSSSFEILGTVVSYRQSVDWAFEGIDSNRVWFVPFRNGLRNRLDALLDTRHKERAATFYTYSADQEVLTYDNLVFRELSSEEILARFPSRDLVRDGSGKWGSVVEVKELKYGGEHREVYQQVIDQIRNSHPKSFLKLETVNGYPISNLNSLAYTIDRAPTVKEGSSASELQPASPHAEFLVSVAGVSPEHKTYFFMSNRDGEGVLASLLYFQIRKTVQTVKDAVKNGSGYGSSYGSGSSTGSSTTYAPYSSYGQSAQGYNSGSTRKSSGGGPFGNAIVSNPASLSGLPVVATERELLTRLEMVLSDSREYLGILVTQTLEGKGMDGKVESSRLSQITSDMNLILNFSFGSGLLTGDNNYQSLVTEVASLVGSLDRVKNSYSRPGQQYNRPVVQPTLNSTVAPTQIQSDSVPNPVTDPVSVAPLVEPVVAPGHTSFLKSPPVEREKAATPKKKKSPNYP